MSFWELGYYTASSQIYSLNQIDQERNIDEHWKKVQKKDPEMRKLPLETMWDNLSNKTGNITKKTLQDYLCRQTFAGSPLPTNVNCTPKVYNSVFKDILAFSSPINS